MVAPESWSALSHALTSGSGALIFLCNQQEAGRWSRLSPFLSNTEQERLATLHHPQQAQDYQFSRQLLRTILANLLNCSATDIQYQIHAKGKPSLEQNVFKSNTIEFNMSHSGSWLAVAVAIHPVGVDLEIASSRPRPWLKLAERFFTATETLWLQNQPDAEHANLFLQMWTQKEATLKAVGCGLSQHLQALDICKENHHLSADDLWLESCQPVAGLYCSVCLPPQRGIMHNHYFILQPELEITPILPPYTQYHSLTLKSL